MGSSGMQTHPFVACVCFMSAIRRSFSRADSTMIAQARAPVSVWSNTMKLVDDAISW